MTSPDAGEGTAKLALDVVTAGPREKRVEASLDVKDLQLAGFGRSTLALPYVRMRLKALAVLDARGLAELRDVKGTLASPPATVQLSVGRIKPSLEGLPILEGGSVTATAKLEDLLDLGRRLADTPEGLDVRGEARFTCALSTTPETVSARNVEVVLSGLNLALEDKRFSEEEIRLSFQATARPSQRAVRLSDGLCELSSGKITMNQLDVPDWAEVPVGVGLDMAASFDLEALLASLKDFVTLPQGVAIKGRAEMEVNAGAPVPDSYTANVRARVTSLEVRAPGLPTLEDEISLEAVAAIAPGSEQVTLDVLKLTSQMMKLTATGGLRGAQFVELEGNAEWDFARIGTLVAAITGQPIEMGGKFSKPFHVKTSLDVKDWREAVRQAFAEAEVGISFVKFKGLEIGPIEMPVRVEDGHAVATIQAKMEGGDVLIPADIDCTGEAAVLTVPEGTPLMANVGLTDAIADQLLARISPIFKGMVAVDGNVGFVCSSLRAPIEGDILNDLTLDGELVLENVSFASSHIVNAILELAKLGGSSVTLPDQRIGVALRHGRVEQKPYTIRVGRYEFVISGSMGLEDGGLDMTVDMPITEEMLSGREELYALLKDDVIRVRVTGTAAKPRVARDVLQSNLKRLLESAAKTLLKKKRDELLKRGLERGLKEIFKR